MKKCLDYVKDVTSAKIMTIAPVKYDGMENSSKYFNYILHPVLIII